jgi:N-acetylglucosaminyldiphosphoundecaprenol N-acetyl-beta-D-mannosaminyltransferase
MAHTDGSTGAHAGQRPVRPRLLGLPVDRGGMDDAVAAVADAVAARRRMRVVVTNANKTWLAQRDPRLQRILENADLIVPEYATVWAANLLGVPDVHHIGGITLMLRLVDEAAARGWSVYLLGAQPGVAEAAAARLVEQRPTLRVAGTHHGYLDEEQRERVEQDLAERRPDLLFIAMGSPLQEYFMDALPPDAGCVALGGGGSFDVVAGLKQDAPPWARGRGLEWAFRLAQDPRRMWRRYLLTNSWFVAQVIRARLSGEQRPPLGPGPADALPLAPPPPPGAQPGLEG